MIKPILRPVLFWALALAIGAGLGLPARPAAAAQPVKTLVNNTGYKLNLTLTVRLGQEPGHICTTVKKPLEAHATTRVAYGSDPECLYLDGLTITWTASGKTQESLYRVNSRGGPSDTLLNTHDTLLFNLKDGYVEAEGE